MRTLLISFKDNEQAEMFVTELAKRQGLLEEDCELNAPDFIGLLRDGAQLDAMVARPTAGCRCHLTTGARKTVGYSETKRFGWPIHSKCNRPTRYIVQHWIQIMLGGTHDLLKELLPSHEEVKDNLDEEARQRVRRQQLRDAAHVGQL